MIQLGLIKKDRFFHRDINWEIEKAAVNVTPPIVTGYKPAHLSLSLVLDELLTFNKYLIILMVRVMTSCVIPFSLCSTWPENDFGRKFSICKRIPFANKEQFKPALKFLRIHLKFELLYMMYYNLLNYLI